MGQAVGQIPGSTGLGYERRHYFPGCPTARTKRSDPVTQQRFVRWHRLRPSNHDDDFASRCFTSIIRGKLGNCSPPGLLELLGQLASDGRRPAAGTRSREIG